MKKVLKAHKIKLRSSSLSSFSSSCSTSFSISISAVLLYFIKQHLRFPFAILKWRTLKTRATIHFFPDARRWMKLFHFFSSALLPPAQLTLLLLSQCATNSIIKLPPAPCWRMGWMIIVTSSRSNELWYRITLFFIRTINKKQLKKHSTRAERTASRGKKVYKCVCPGSCFGCCCVVARWNWQCQCGGSELVRHCRWRQAGRVSRWGKA